MKCDYCGKDRDNTEGWHNCHQAQDAKARIDGSIEKILRIVNHTSDQEPMTADQLRERSDRRRDMAQRVRLTGGPTPPEYEPLSESDYNGRE